jgi:hypothetical protein
MFVNFYIHLLSFYVKYKITFKNVCSIQWGKPINIDQQGYWPPDNIVSVWSPRLRNFILPLCNSAYRNCRSIRPSSSLKWRIDWYILTSFNMGISDNSQDRIISMVTRVWTGWPAVRIQVQTLDCLDLLSKIPRQALGTLYPPIHWVSGGGEGHFPGSKEAGVWSWSFISNYKVTNKCSYTFVPLYAFMPFIGTTSAIMALQTIQNLFHFNFLQIVTQTANR